MTRRVLLIGWDAADWKIIRPLLEVGEMPFLQSLIRTGAHGNLATIRPILSPMLWTSIATGKRAYKHGIHGFVEPRADGSGLRPISILSRQTKAIWNILHQTGRCSVVVGWWPSHPAEPIRGAMVSNHFQKVDPFADLSQPLAPGTVHPSSLAASLAELRVKPTELDGDILRLFVPDFDKVDQENDKTLHALASIVSETMSLHAVATELLEREPWDLAAIYYDSIDHFCHRFMAYHPPLRDHVPESDFELYQHVVRNAYRYHDVMLGRLLQLAGNDATVVLLSDHGFHPDLLRPRYIPAEPAGPAVEHRPYGILCVRGPDVKPGHRIYGASILDICPTTLALFGLPAGRDMDGKVLNDLFVEPPALARIESWDTEPGDAGLHPPDQRVDAASSAEAFRQLVDLGYVAPPGADARQNIEDAIAELNYNLAQACQDGNEAGRAARLLQDLWADRPKEHRFGVAYIEALGTLGRVAERRQAIETLTKRIAHVAQEAVQRLLEEEGRERKSGGKLKPDEEYELRRLGEQAMPKDRLLIWLRVSQFLLERDYPGARREFRKLGNLSEFSPELWLRAAGACVQMGKLDRAAEFVDRIMAADPESHAALSLAAEIHFRQKRFAQSIKAAAESLSLVYSQPTIHALLGEALLATGEVDAAEQELHVALSQNPKVVRAHESLARIYREHRPQPAQAFAHEGLARSLRTEARLRQATAVEPLAASAANPLPAAPNTYPLPVCAAGAAWPGVPNEQIVTIVSGLPRSGTSMMMQALRAGGIPPLTDEHRPADSDNPLGYFEFRPALELARNGSWMPQARGKVVKIVAQLLPHLPSGEKYRVLFMHRGLREIVASQRAMLDRLGREGGRLDDADLMTVFRNQLHLVLARLAARQDVRVLHVEYTRTTDMPAQVLADVATFLDGALDAHLAAESIHPELHRQRH